MKTQIQERIENAIASTPDRSPARRKALSAITWRLRFGLLYAGLDGTQCVLVAQDDPRCQVFDGRDNEAMKAKYYSAVLGCPMEVELC